ncbi:MAG TPA: J domain-containing protein [Pyrinomonadaceae bacterium]|jgi:hypothetical protein
MNRELNNCYEVLGVAEGASAQELKVAYRDLAKVWHPDRFVHDPRLQQKAQDKLKEINEAYEQLISGKIRFQRQTSNGAQTHTQTSTPPQTSAPRRAWQLYVLPVCLFMFVLLAAGYFLMGSRHPAPQQPEQEVRSGNVEQTSTHSVRDEVREPQRAARKPTPKQLAAGEKKEPMAERAATVTAPPTVTLTIDPATGLIASAHCPVKSRMTYVDGTEPRLHCSLHKSDTGTPADRPPNESRLKSLTKRLASPTKWFRGKEKSASARRETPASPDTGNQH